jgi:hypothetical protein
MMYMRTEDRATWDELEETYRLLRQSKQGGGYPPRSPDLRVLAERLTTMLDREEKARRHVEAPDVPAYIGSTTSTLTGSPSVPSLSRVSTTRSDRSRVRCIVSPGRQFGTDALSVGRISWFAVWANEPEIEPLHRFPPAGSVWEPDGWAEHRGGAIR